MIPDRTYSEVEKKRNGASASFSSLLLSSHSYSQFGAAIPHRKKEGGRRRKKQKVNLARTNLRQDEEGRGRAIIAFCGTNSRRNAIFGKGDRNRGRAVEKQRERKRRIWRWNHQQ